MTQNTGISKGEFYPLGCDQIDATTEVYLTIRTRTIRHPQPIEESKLQGYFMISRRDAAIAITNKLTGSQCRLWLYLMLIDPFADYTPGGEIKYHDLPSIAEIALAVGSCPDTVEKDLRRLRKLGLYGYRTLAVQGYNSTAANARAESERLKSKHKSTPKPAQNKDSAYSSPNGDYSSSNGDYLSPNGDYLSPNGDYSSSNGDYLSGKREPEPLPDKSYSISSDSSDFSDFIKTLSRSERENFIKFGRKKAAQLPKEPELPLRWIEKNFRELHSQWLQLRNENENQKPKYNFAAYSEQHHQIWYEQLKNLVSGVIEFGNRINLELWLQDNFCKNWVSWAKTAREDVREFLASHPLPEGLNYGF